MKIYINSNILEKLKAHDVSLDYAGTIIIILLCLYEQNYKLLDQIDDENKSKRILLLYRYLYRRDLIEEVKDDDFHYDITEKGISLVKYILSFSDEEMEVKKECLNEVLEIEDDVENWIDEYINLFPSQKFNGRSLRTNRQDCLYRMKWFLKEFKFTKQTILLATRKYIEDETRKNYNFLYTRNSTYFICKGRGPSQRISDLATECSKLKDGEQLIDNYIERDAV